MRWPHHQQHRRDPAGGSGLFAPGRTSAVASASLETWAALLSSDAATLVDASTLASEKAAIAAYFD